MLFPVLNTDEHRRKLIEITIFLDLIPQPRPPNTRHFFLHKYNKVMSEVSYDYRNVMTLIVLMGNKIEMNNLNGRMSDH